MAGVDVKNSISQMAGQINAFQKRVLLYRTYFGSNIIPLFILFFLFFFCDEFETSFNGESELGSMKPSEN